MNRSSKIYHNNTIPDMTALFDASYEYLTTLVQLLQLQSTECDIADSKSEGQKEKLSLMSLEMIFWHSTGDLNF